MENQEGKSDDKYRTLRNEFDDLQLEEKAVFLIESALSLFIHGIDSFTRFVRDEINNMAEGAKGNDTEDVEEEVEEEESADTAEDSEFAKEIASEDEDEDDAPDTDKEDSEEEKK